jgi:hypothetical protein
MEFTIEQERLAYTLKRRMLKMVEDCSTTECRSSLSIMRQDVINILELLGSKDMSYFDLFVNIEEEKMGEQTFEEAVKPLMKWLCENKHPHTTAIITGNLAELVEGVESVKTDEFIVD